MVEGDRRRIVGHAAARAEAGSIRVRPPEEVEPELRVIALRIILDQGELRPAHWLVEPPCRVGWGVFVHERVAPCCV